MYDSLSRAQAIAHYDLVLLHFPFDSRLFRHWSIGLLASVESTVNKTPAEVYSSLAFSSLAPRTSFFRLFLQLVNVFIVLRRGALAKRAVHTRML